jgi:ketosteroid isomerase-like protein
MKTARFFLIGIIMLQCAQAQLAQQGGEAAVRAAREQSNRAITQHDIKAFEQTLSPDFVMVRGSSAFVPSKAAYVKLFAEGFADPKAITYRRITDQVEVSSAAPLAAEHGHWVGLNPDGTTAYKGTYLAMWRWTKDRWLLRSELYVVLACEQGPACRGYVRGTAK